MWVVKRDKCVVHALIVCIRVVCYCIFGLEGVEKEAVTSTGRERES